MDVSSLSQPTEPIVLPRDWFTFREAPGVRLDLPGLYEWRIEGVGSYIGKFSRIRRPTREYGRNVTRLLNGRPYRKGKRERFRRIHRELAAAHRKGLRIELVTLENVWPADLNRREAEVIRERGSLNDPPFGRRAKLVVPPPEGPNSN